jgi:hypothetical protein
MNYEQLFSDLAANPPTGWRVLHYFSNSNDGGVYFWPNEKSLLMESPYNGLDMRLGHYSILFEFHTTPKGTARILARARYYGATDQRWKNWHNEAVKHCHADKPKDKKGNSTKAVGKWSLGKLTTPAQAAPVIRAFFANLPTSLKCFVVHF